METNTNFFYGNPMEDSEIWNKINLFSFFLLFSYIESNFVSFSLRPQSDYDSTTVDLSHNPMHRRPSCPVHRR